MNYSTQAKRLARKYDGKFDSDNFVNAAGVLANIAQSFMHDVKGNASEIANDGMKYTKRQGAKHLRKLESALDIHPTRNYVYAMGVGAVLTYLLLPRK